MKNPVYTNSSHWYCLTSANLDICYLWYAVTTCGRYEILSSEIYDFMIDELKLQTWKQRIKKNKLHWI